MDFDFNYYTYGDEFEEQDPTEDKNNGIQGSYIPNHLSSPIIDDDCKFLLKYDEFYCTRHIKLKTLINQFEIKSDIYSSCKDPYLCLRSYILNESVNNDSLKNLSRLIDLSVESLEISTINYLESCLSLSNILTIKERMSMLKSYLKNNIEMLLPYYETMKKTEIIKEHLCLNRVPFGELITRRDIMIERDIFFFNCKDHGWTIGPTNLFLCCLDINQSRYSIIFYFVLADFFDKYPGKMLTIGLSLIEVFETLRLNYGDNVYKVLSVWESLVIGYAINDDINDLGFSALYETSKETIISIIGSQVYNEISEIILPRVRTKDNIKLYLEMTGISKHFGHPCLKVKDGFENVRDHGTKKAFVDQKLANACKGIFIRDFVKEYYHKKRRWPALKYIPEDLQLHYLKNLYPPKKLEKDYTLWSMIQFDKIFDFDYSPDTTELIKDTASAPEYDQWFLSYDNCAFKHLYKKTKPRYVGIYKPTRVIERFLIGTEHEVLKKISELDSRFFDEKDNTAVLCRKEQELKVEGRLFVKQTYEQRLAQTAMENNIAKQVMRYIPEQTMTDGELQQTRRLVDAAKSQGDNLEIFNLDLSKWNMRFRHALVSPFGVVLDQMFGLNYLYTYNHIWFIKAKVFNNSRLFPPDYNDDLTPIPGDYFYSNHLGGMEGMRQKLWTIITICIIKLAAEELNLAIDIMCQGDNQVVMIRYKPRQLKNKKELRNLFLKGLEDKLRRLNLLLKKEETWFSTKLCEFGKIRYFYGEAVSSMLKKGTRLIPDINDGVCSFLSSLSTINTITESMSKYDFSPDISFVINQFHVLNYLLRKEVINNNELPIDWIRFLFHPTDFGGITLSTYMAHFIRGYDDKVNLWISIILTLKRHYPHIFKKVISLNQIEPNPGEIKYSRLIEDIFCLNIRALPSLEMKFKELALTHLKSPTVKNPEIRKLFESETTISSEKLINIVITMKPLILSVAHELIRNSNSGILLALRTRFSNIQTINKIVQRTYNQDFLDLMKVNNQNLIKILKCRKQNVESYFTLEHLKGQNCPTRITELLREKHWKLNMIGETKSNPLHQSYIRPLDLCKSVELSNSITIQLSNEYHSRYHSQFLKDGPFVAYLGSATKEKVKKPTLDISTKTSYSKAIQQLYLMSSWFKRLGCKNLLKLTTQLINEKEGVMSDLDNDYEIEDWCAINYGGNILHRFKSMIERNTAVLNFLPTVATHIRQSTNYLSNITSGGRDFTIHFQLILLFNISRIIKLKEYKIMNSSQYGSVITCNHCTKEITLIEFDIDEPDYDVTVPIISEQVLQLTDYKYSSDELCNFLSIYLGRKFGIAADVYYNKLYLDEKAISNIRLIPQLTLISVNDMRFVSWDKFVVGIFQGSKTMRNFLLHCDQFDISFFRCKIFEPLSQFLINANMLQSFLLFFELSAIEHSQLILPEKISEILTIGFIRYFWKNPKLFLTNYIHYNFKNEDINVIYHRVSWVRSYLYKNYDQLGLQKQIFQKGIYKAKTNVFNFITDLDLRIGTKIVIPRSKLISEDEIITYVRKRMTENDLICSRKDNFNPIPINYFSVNHNDIITQYKSYYIKLVNNQSGNYFIPEIHQLTRIKGNISTAITKILEIFLFLNIKRSAVKNIYCLAEGSGSIIEGLANIYTEASIWYNTLLVPEVDFRLGPDQNYPPSVMNSKTIPVTRIPKSNNLAIGTTDILSDIFKSKLASNLLIHPGNIVTIDAESNFDDGNLYILKEYSNILSKYKCDLIIIKYFYIEEEFNFNHEEYDCVNFKPLSSNPNNLEVYFLMIRKGLIDDQKSIIQSLLNLWRITVTTIGKCKLATIEIIEDFIKISEWIYWIINKKFPYINEPITVLSLLGVKNLCNLYCKNSIIPVIKLIEKLDEITIEENYIYPLFREQGLVSMIERLCKLCFILIIRIKVHNKVDFLRFVYQARIDTRIRSHKDPFSSNLLYDTYDWKSILRNLTIFNNCNCKKTTEEIRKSINLQNKFLMRLFRDINSQLMLNGFSAFII